MPARTKKTKEEVSTLVEAPKPQPVKIRDENGLLKGVQYHFKPNGLVDWRKMISPEHIVMNRMVLAGKGLDPDSISADTMAKLVEESPEENLVIKLAGFREVAEIRGFSAILPEVVSASPDYVVMKVTIDWINNFETSNSDIWSSKSVGAVASASRESVDDKFAKYLETIAENRAFVRAVRHSLGIIAVGQDEIKQDDVKAEVRNTKIQSLLSDLMSKLNNGDKPFDLEALKDLATNEGLDWNEKWISVEKIDPAAVMTLIPILKKLQS